jgi:hypothetical protein
MNESNTYECEICHGINHVNRYHCQTCDTIPTRYSWLRKPIRERLNTTVAFSPMETIRPVIEVYVAFGVERQASRRTIKRTIRTVPLDYYATE